MSKPVVVGEVVGAFGVQGWVKVRSFTDPAGNILGYRPWIISRGAESKIMQAVSGRMQGSVVVAKFDGVEDRDQAQALKGARVAVPRECFPAASRGEYYWVDLVGLEVLTTGGRSLGTVKDLVETGANDVLAVKGDRERLIPFVAGQFVKEVNLEEGRLVVDWDPDF